MLADRSSATTLRASSLISQTMSPPLRSHSPPPSSSSSHSRSRVRQSPKSSTTPSFHLGNLPRFHPAVYQSPIPAASGSPSPQPTSASSSSANTTSSTHIQQYRIQPNSRDSLHQYREIVAGITLTPRGTVSSAYVKPSKPRLAPLGSPGPVTPLALEDQDGGYLTAGARNMSSNGRHGHGDAPPEELLEELIQRERERLATTPHHHHTPRNENRNR